MPRGRAPAPALGNNRVDLLTPQPISAVPDQAYGAAAAQEAAQRGAPMAGGATKTPAAPASSGPPNAPQGAAGPGDILAQAAAFNGPGGSMAIDRPTERPNEPVSHGLPVGPGGGPEALQGVGAAARDNAVEQGTLKDVIMNMAQAPGATSAIRDLASRAAGGVA